MNESRIENLRSRLKEQSAGCQLLYTQNCGSTNEWAKESSDRETACVFLTDCQTKGRGRFDRVWESKKGASLTFSLRFPLQCRLRNVSMLTEVAALAVCAALQKECKTAFGIKWPNDVVKDTKKVCGILTEMTENAVVIGIGINLTKEAYPPNLKVMAVSLEEVCKTAVDQDEILLSVIRFFFEKALIFYKTEDMRLLKKEYEALLVNIGKKVTLTSKDQVCIGTAKGIDDRGRLTFTTQDNETLFVDSGEVSVSGFYGTL